MSTVWDSEDDEAPDPRAQGDSEEAVSDRAWFGSSPEGQWGYGHYSRGNHHLTDRREEEEREDEMAKKVRVKAHTRKSGKPKPKPKHWWNR